MAFARLRDELERADQRAVDIDAEFETVFGLVKIVVDDLLVRRLGNHVAQAVGFIAKPVYVLEILTRHSGDTRCAQATPRYSVQMTKFPRKISFQLRPYSYGSL